MRNTWKSALAGIVAVCLVSCSSFASDWPQDSVNKALNYLYAQLQLINAGAYVYTNRSQTYSPGTTQAMDKLSAVYIVNPWNGTVIYDSDSAQFMNGNGDPSIDLNQSYLIDGHGHVAVNWERHELSGTNGVASLNSGTMQGIGTWDFDGLTTRTATVDRVVIGSIPVISSNNALWVYSPIVITNGVVTTGLVVTGTLTPDATGNYYANGTYGGKTMYFRMDGAFDVFWEFDKWDLYDYFDPNSFWDRSGANIAGTYNPQGTAIGTATVSFGDVVTNTVYTTNYWQQIQYYFVPDTLASVTTRGNITTNEITVGAVNSTMFGSTNGTTTLRGTNISFSAVPTVNANPLICFTNGTTIHDGVLNGTNGIYYVKGGTNYWELFP